MCSQLLQGGSRQPSPSSPRTEADDTARLMEPHLAVGTLSDIAGAVLIPTPFAADSDPVGF